MIVVMSISTSFQIIVTLEELRIGDSTYTNCQFNSLYSISLFNDASLIELPCILMSPLVFTFLTDDKLAKTFLF